MKEKKFRCWNGEKMSKPFTLNMIIDRGLILEDEEIFDLEEDEVIEYTGLKDKNGKEIYEGDKFQIAKSKIYIVKYSDGMEEHGYEFYGGCFLLTSDIPSFPFDEYAIKEGEVIENIYEDKI